MFPFAPAKATSSSSLSVPRPLGSASPEPESPVLPAEPLASPPLGGASFDGAAAPRLSSSPPARRARVAAYSAVAGYRSFW
ncbi:UNVERIFIED_CONTAM: hypothetical protein HDU68_007987 [Siphonaria sp. JEL0065]|nr:hypothetical protein HDU68_007987 [Siphonaria sp. JEL0065]